MKNKNNFLRSFWYKFNEYEILSDKYIIPKASSKLTKYDPLIQNEEFRKKNKNQIFTDLIKINQAENVNKKQKLALIFAKSWGLPGTLTHCCEQIQLAPRLGSINFSYSDIEDKELQLKIKLSKKNIILDSKDLKIEDSDGTKKYKGVHNSIDFLTNFTSKIKYKALVPVQPIYTYMSGQWSPNLSRTLIIKDKNKFSADIKFNQCIPKNHFPETMTRENHISSPGYWYKEFNLNETSPNFEHFLHNNTSEFKLFYQDEDKFINYFPRITNFLKKKYPTKEEFNLAVHSFAWPLPESDEYFQEYAEPLENLYKLSEAIENTFRNFDLADKVYYKDKQDKKIKKNRLNEVMREVMYKANISNLTSQLELIPSIESENIGFRLSSRSLMSLIGYIIIGNLTSDNRAKFCKCCGFYMGNPRPGAIFCHTKCRVLHFTRNARAKKKSN